MRGIRRKAERDRDPRQHVDVRDVKDGMRDFCILFSALRILDIVPPGRSVSLSREVGGADVEQAEYLFLEFVELGFKDLRDGRALLQMMTL